jgi:hypothetical protein
MGVLEEQITIGASGTFAMRPAGEAGASAFLWNPTRRATNVIPGKRRERPACLSPGKWS